MIRYFREGLRLSIRAQLDVRGRELDFWEEAVKKVVNAEAKVLLQSFSNTRNIDSKCSQKNKPAKKEEKDSGKTKSTETASVNASSSKY